MKIDDIIDKYFIGGNYNENQIRRIAAIISLWLLLISHYFNLPGDMGIEIFFYVIVCSLVAVIGANRKIGLGRAQLVSLLLTPIVGFIVTLSSERTK
jgi:hypothetical protein